MFDITRATFVRKFSTTLYKNLKLGLMEMSFAKDFVSGPDGDLYPILSRSECCSEKVEYNRYTVSCGEVKRLIGQFFPYATYEVVANVGDGGEAGFSFSIPGAEATIITDGKSVRYLSGAVKRDLLITEELIGSELMAVSCRPGAFDIYFEKNGKVEFFATVNDELFNASNDYPRFFEGNSALVVRGSADSKRVCAYLDSGVSIADIRPVKYENGDVLIEGGRVYLTATIRMQAGGYQGVFSWVPGTTDFELVGAIFYDAGDGLWCGDVAASLRYHRERKLWYLWVCSFSHGHILASAEFSGDVRFGVNVLDVKLIEAAIDSSNITDFVGFHGDEDPDFLYDEDLGKWLMAVCRRDDVTKKYRYFFFESNEPFGNYRYIGRGYEGAETGGSFIKVGKERYFVCGNDFNKTSDYRIYSKDGMVNAAFDFPDGGFRGWGTIIPVRLGNRTRYFWLTFDRHLASDYKWSYGNLYCFEAKQHKM